MPRIFVCQCEDVLLREVEEAIDQGHEDIESLKRFTGLGTGVCQGKSCVTLVARVLAQRAGVPVGTIAPFTPRPPVSPVPLGLLAAPDAEEETP